MKCIAPLKNVSFFSQRLTDIINFPFREFKYKEFRENKIAFPAVSHYLSSTGDL